MRRREAAARQPYSPIDGKIGAILAAARGELLKRHLGSLIPVALVATIIALAPTPVQAQDYTWSLSLMGGIGSALREGGGSGGGYQVGFGLQFEPGANVWLHAGELDFETGSGVGDLADGTITDVNLGGEYQFNENYYDSGIFIGLGAYDLESRLVLAEGVLAPAASETVLGLVLGATGEFKITPSFVFLVEVTAHILDSSDVRVLGTAHAGFGLHF
jgi:hypothetical protein